MRLKMRVYCCVFTVCLAFLLGLEAAAFSTRAHSPAEYGAALFQKVWSRAEGLGPRFNAQSCIACHADPALGAPSPIAR